MPSWGRPPGARTGRQNRGRAWEEARVEEVDSEEDVYGREMVRSGRYMRQLEYGGRGPRRRSDYDELTDDESVDGGDFDLYDHEDSTVAYAVQLAMRDKEDQLVDKALERIRRAQMLGQKNVRLSKRELDALERKRQQMDGPSGSRRPKQSTNPASAVSRPSSRRSAAPEQHPGPYPAFAPDTNGWARGTGASRPSSSSSARPRTPTTQSLRPQQSYSPYTPDRFASNGRPQSLQQSPMYQRPLPDDPQWAPSYYNQMQMTPYGEAPYQSQLPTDLRVGPQSRMSYPSGSPYQTYQSPRDTHPQGTQPRGEKAESESEVSSEEVSESSDDEVQIVKVQERPAPPTVQRRAVSGASRGARKRTNR